MGSRPPFSVNTRSPTRKSSTAAGPVSVSIRVPVAKPAARGVSPLTMVKSDALTGEPKMIDPSGAGAQTAVGECQRVGVGHRQTGQRAAAERLPGSHGIDRHGNSLSDTAIFALAGRRVGSGGRDPAGSCKPKPGMVSIICFT